jgi:hypothetical protein
MQAVKGCGELLHWPVRGQVNGYQLERSFHVFGVMRQGYSDMPRQQ